MTDRATGARVPLGPPCHPGGFGSEEFGPLEACREIHEAHAVNPEHTQHFIRRLRPLLPPDQGRYGIFGCYAFNCYNVPRETHDVDIAVRVRELETIVASLERDLPPPYSVKRTDAGAIVRYEGAKIPKIGDLVVAELNPVLDAALRDPRATRRIRVPRFGDAWTLSPEAIVATKYYAASEPRRGDKRFADVSEMLMTYKERENQPIDMDLLRKLVAAVPLPRAAQIFEDILATVAAGRIPHFPWGALDE